MILVRYVLFGLFVWLVATIAAFVYLAWWQAILVSIGTVFVLGLGLRLMLRLFLKDLMGTAKMLFEIKSKVLRGATVDVHFVKSISPPSDLIEHEEGGDEPEPGEYEQALAEINALNWFEIELTIFPDPAAKTPMKLWDIYDLVFVPGDAPPPASFEEFQSDDDIGFTEVEVIVNGQPQDPESGKVRGPQRLRIVAGLPKNLDAVQLRYYTEQFGRVPLPR